MNVGLTLVLIAVVAAMGGIAHGYMTYGGVVFPQKEKRSITIGTDPNTKDVTIVMWMPGAIGQGLFGAIAGILTFCVYSQPSLVLGLHVNVSLTLYQVGVSLLTGLAGSVAVSNLIDQQQWTKLAPVLQAADPATTPQVQGTRAFETLKLIGTPTA